MKQVAGIIFWHMYSWCFRAGDTSFLHVRRESVMIQMDGSGVKIYVMTMDMGTQLQ